MELSFKNTVTILVFLLLVITAIVVYLFWFNNDQQIKLMKSEERIQEEKTNEFKIPELYPGLNWSQVSDKKFEPSLIIDNIDFVEKRKDILQEYIDLSGIEYVSQTIFEKDKSLEEKLSRKVNEYFLSEFKKKGFRETVDIPDYKITLRGIVADSPGSSIIGFVKYNAGKVRVIVFQEVLEINSDCKVRNINIWNVDDYPECYFGDQFKVFVSNIVNIKDIFPKQFLRLVHNECLEEDEIVNYGIKKKENEISTADIIIADKNNNQEKYRFQIELPIPDHYHPLELHKCGIYAVKSSGYDYKNRTSLPGYKAEIWKYDYKGNGEPVVLIAEDPMGNLKGYKYFFSTDFRVDSQEKYLVLIKSYSNKDDYSLIIKDLKTKQDLFVLSAKDIAEQYPNIVGNFNMREWSKDARYFWGDIFVGAYVKGFFRIDTLNWKTDIFEVLEGVGGGDALNTEKSLVTRHPGYVWTGLDILTEEIKKEWREQGKKSALYLYNLFTKEQILLETTNEPLWFFKPKWLSDTELEYESPTGEKEIYRISE